MQQTTSSNNQQQSQEQSQSRTLTQPYYILALDIGTSSVRALLYDASGTAVPHVHAQQTYTVTTSSDGEVSVDADMLVDLVAKAIDETLSAAGPLTSQIKAVATDTFWHSLLGVDASGRPLMPLLTWEDTRPRRAAAELRAQLDEDAVHKRTGARIHASYWPAKLRWLSTAQPELFKRTAKWLSFGEYLHRKFLGRSVCSLSMASGTGMLVTRTCSWDSHLQELLGVRAEQLPPLGDLHDSLTGLKPAFASRWPALQDIPWFPAIGDGAAANVGSGCATAENWAITIGTSSAIRVIVPPDIVPPKGLWLYLLDEKRGLLGGALSEGGNILAWLASTLKLPPLVEAESLIATLPPDGHGLTILPFLSGERSPGWHDEASMAITGINSHTSPADLLRATLESLAYQLDEVYDQLNIALEKQEIAPTLIGSGGAMLSSRTLQDIIADTLNAPLYPSLEREASTRGVALLALETLGIIPDVAHATVELGAPVLPDEAHHSIYEHGIKRHQRLYYTLLGE
jgi:gluconokinase